MLLKLHHRMTTRTGEPAHGYEEGGHTDEKAETKAE